MWMKNLWHPDVKGVPEKLVPFSQLAIALPGQK